MPSSILFVIGAGIASGLWSVFHDRGATHINPFIGAIVVQFVALIVGAIALTTQLKTSTLIITREGLMWTGLAGVAALTIDLFTLRAYAAGLPLSIGGVLYIGMAVLVTTGCGLIFFGESLTLAKAMGITLVTIGAILLTFARG